jgi:hypothetical protein
MAKNVNGFKVVSAHVYNTSTLLKALEVIYPLNALLASKFGAKFLPFQATTLEFSTTWARFVPYAGTLLFAFRLLAPIPTDYICFINSIIVNERVWMDCAFSLHVSRTWLTWHVIFDNLDSFLVIHEDKVGVFRPYKEVSIGMTPMKINMSTLMDL